MYVTPNVQDTEEHTVAGDIWDRRERIHMEER